MSRNERQRMNAAANKHRRAHWKAEREATSASRFTIDTEDGACFVVDDGKRVAGLLDGFGTPD